LPNVWLFCVLLVFFRLPFWELPNTKMRQGRILTLLCVDLQRLALKPKDPKAPKDPKYLDEQQGGYLIPEWERSKLDNGESH